MVASLNDPYSHYFDPTDYSSFMNETNPHLSGIGIDVLLDPQGLRVIDVFAGSPAARAGLKGGDLIVRVGSTSLASRSADYELEPDRGQGRHAGHADRAARRRAR